MTAVRIVTDATEFFKQINSYLPVDQRLCVQEAFAFARREHGDQRRKSGELFFIHPLTVAYYLSEYHLDSAALSAALLHDIAEDTRVSIDDIERRFGKDVALLVDGVTKLKDVTLGVSKGRKLSPEELQNASLHKMFDVMTADVRTVIVKLFDRLHNMRTIKALPERKQRQKAEETLTVYAPLANRLGIWKVKNELEALSLEVLNQSAYELIKTRREHLLQEQQAAYKQVSAEIFDCLLQANLDVRDVMLAPENIYTVYQDLTARGASYYDVDRTLRLIVLMDDWPSCYLALGHLHRLWKPVPGRFDDYVAVPLDNLYRSLHTTVVHSDGQYVKLRIRTVEMDKVSEIGVLARWLYAGTPLWTTGIANRIDSFISNITENISVEVQDPGAGVKGVVEDVFRKQIRVYTPRGDVVELGQGATAIDFAYSIHTGLGNQCHAAYVNDQLYPLNRPLHDGDRVQIVKSVRAEPQRAWLDEDLGYIATNYARSHARRWFRRLSKGKAVFQGKKLLESELEMLGLPDYPHVEIAAAFKYESTTELYHDIGRADVLLTAVATSVLENTWGRGPARNLDDVVYSVTGEKYVIVNAHKRKLRLCATCNPHPGDAIAGFVRADGGVTVHQETCHTLRPNRLSGRILKLGWGKTGTRQARLLTVQVDVFDRPGLLYDITRLMQDEQINISFINTMIPSRKGEKHVILGVEVVRPRQLVRILHQIQAIANVFAVRCLPETPSQDESFPTKMPYKPE
ncbi:MAG: bifunctional (p)ppGpp synthetase/guanosine-3',5'-bis(diphosphate) 3'-pyrophosphohydrolase [Ardenticatenaceae bacterium]|nr:bifunctional (p)ppGpp synthetase/guanosine-3',5'-bis(diphosphate) 3'-pyrophosphohydrolase [Anaerolineales bacterium]MCB8921289.1 bifunctional (p)ppGpp synthetase/guanosine-3',5'-bis(diphosphate) 3'-pyrophosphohydrolase [Ardenticatenaceae bacterium]MCB8990655.1 bifunctional (p)ppGpp synthetase/guanosine-3',5'-bis(diphosphate) 3'-pyrophosphohydrolase [Ardenticatenaceae bacterium]